MNDSLTHPLIEVGARKNITNITRKKHNHHQDQSNHQEVGERLDDVESLCNLLAFLQRSCNTAGGGTLDKVQSILDGGDVYYTSVKQTGPPFYHNWWVTFQTVPFYHNSLVTFWVLAGSNPWQVQLASLQPSSSPEKKVIFLS